MSPTASADSADLVFEGSLGVGFPLPGFPFSGESRIGATWDSESNVALQLGVFLLGPFDRPATWYFGYLREFPSVGDGRWGDVSAAPQSMNGP